MPTGEHTGTTGGAAAQPVRMNLVEAARRRWVDQLIDTSRRNNLLFFRPVLGGSIEVPEGNQNLPKLIHGKNVGAASLLPDALDRPGRILNIARKARENHEEKGLETLYLALGFATWKAEDGGRDYRAPVFLFPLAFSQRGSEYNSVDVKVALVLENRGLKLVPQVGCSQFRIDFGVCHPDQPGRFIMAIECDGASYHSSATARDRDRLRQQVLENLGWTFHRIWSTDWFLRKEDEVERAWKAYQAALQRPIETHPISKSDAGNTPQEAMVDGQEDGLAQPKRYPAAPPIPMRGNITEYSHRELRNLYEWVASDGILRTHDEVADEMFRALPFSRRGARIESALRKTIIDCENRNPLP